MNNPNEQRTTMNIPAEAVQAASSVYENHTGVRDTLIVENILEAAAPFLLAGVGDDEAGASA